MAFACASNAGVAIYDAQSPAGEVRRYLFSPLCLSLSRLAIGGSVEEKRAEGAVLKA